MKYKWLEVERRISFIVKTDSKKIPTRNRDSKEKKLEVFGLNLHSKTRKYRVYDKNQFLTLKLSSQNRDNFHSNEDNNISLEQRTAKKTAAAAPRILFT